MKKELEEAIDDVCDWLDYNFDEEAILPSIKRLNRARLNLEVAKRRIVKNSTGV